MSHDDIENVGSNRSGNRHIGEVVAARYSRRSILTGGTAALALTFFGGAQTAGASPAGAASAARRGLGRGPRIGFTPVPTSSADALTIPPEYTAEVLIPWGTPLFSGVEWRKDATNTAADQEKQVGFNHDGMHFFPLAKGSRGTRRGLLVVNHEYTDANQIYSAAQGSAITYDATGREKVAKAVAAHGVTVVEVVQQTDGSWTHVVDSPYNRRITGTTPVAFSGPVTLAHPALASNNAPMGTLNNCSHGYTPWGTYLTCEENWNGYFGTSDAAWKPNPEQARYGVSATGFGYPGTSLTRASTLRTTRANSTASAGWSRSTRPTRTACR